MNTVYKEELVLLFERRISLPHNQIQLHKKYIPTRKPVVGIRTANHAFTPRDSVAAGFEAWPEFVADVMGCENRGYGPVEPGMDVQVNDAAAGHPIIKGVAARWHSQGNIYLVAPLLDPKAVVLLTGTVNDITQPVAWTRLYGKSRVFYTSLGFPADFSTPQFNSLLVNAIKWSLDKNFTN